LSKAYDGKHGDQLIAELAAQKAVDVLEALWRVQQPELRPRLVPVFASSGDSTLTDLLADEVGAPSSSEPTYQALVAALERDYPPVSPAATQRAVDRLRDPATLTAGAFQNQRGRLEGWAASQSNALGEAFAIDVIAGKTPAHNQAAQNAAVAQAQANPQLRDQAIQVLTEQLDQQRVAAEWQRATAFVESVAKAGDAPSKDLLALLALLVATAPELASQPAFSPVTTDLLARHGYNALRDRLDGAPIGAAKGSIALTRAVDGLTHSTRRQALIRLLLRRHPALVPYLIEFAKAWNDDTWRSTVDGLNEKLAADGSVPAHVQSLLREAPGSVSRAVVEAGLRLSPKAADAASLADGVAAVVRKALNDAGDEREPRVAAMGWTADGDSMPFIRDVVTRATSDTSAAARLIADAQKAGSISPADAAEMIDERQLPAFLDGLADEMSTRRREAFSRLFGRHPDRMRALVTERQKNAFDLDLAIGAIAHDEGAALTGVDASVYAGLDDEQRDDLLSVIEEHGTWKSKALLGFFGADSVSKRRPLRARALRKIGEVAPRGQALPDFVHESITMPDPEVRQAAFGAIAAVAPRDLDLVRELVSLAAARGAARAAADETLDRMVASYVTALDTAATKSDRATLLRLIGAAARSASIAPLLAHVGRDTEDDATEVRMAAAEGLAEAAQQHHAFGAAQVERLGQIFEDGEEADPEVAAQLDLALRRMTLGEDQAVEKLFQMTNIPLAKRSPSELFGAEKTLLVRHVGLMAAEQARGKAAYPQYIEQLDLVALALVRAAYARVGTSIPLKNEIAKGDPKSPDYGPLLGALGGALDKARAPLQVVHQLRSEKTEYTHPGQAPTDDDATNATENFINGARICLGILNK
jgi:hypothetical protein